MLFFLSYSFRSEEPDQIMVMRLSREVISVCLIDSIPQSMCAVPRRGVFCTLCFLMFLGILWVYFSFFFFKSHKTLMTTVIVLLFLSHIPLISISKYLYFGSFSVTLVEVLR